MKAMTPGLSLGNKFKLETVDVYPWCKSNPDSVARPDRYGD